MAHILCGSYYSQQLLLTAKKQALINLLYNICLVKKVKLLASSNSDRSRGKHRTKRRVKVGLITWRSRQLYQHFSHSECLSQGYDDGCVSFSFWWSGLLNVASMSPVIYKQDVEYNLLVKPRTLWSWWKVISFIRTFGCLVVICITTSDSHRRCVRNEP